MRINKVGLLIVVAMIGLTGHMRAQVARAQDDRAQVTLRIFSGRPDPTWTLSAAETEAFRHILETLPAGVTANITDNLGFFEIHLGEEIVYIADDHVQITPQTRWLTDSNHALQLWLLGTAGDALEPNLIVPLWSQFAELPQTNTSGFGIYLVTGDLTPTEAAQADISTLQWLPEPVIGMDDITIYHAATHEFELTAAGLAKLQALQVPVSGLPFVVCVDGEPIYAGAFWTSLSSLSYYDSVVLDVLKFPLRLESGYPAPFAELYRGDDRRSDTRILSAFKQAGKLD